MAPTTALGPARLHDIWKQLDETERLDFLGSLSSTAANALLGHQVSLKTLAERSTVAVSRPTTVTRRPAIVAPPGPMERWTDAELAAFIQAGDAEIAAEQAASVPAKGVRVVG
jgi:hypothetical protein